MSTHTHMLAGTSAEQLWNWRGAKSEWQAAGYAHEGNGEPVPRIAVLLIGDGRDKLRYRLLETVALFLYGYEMACVIEVDDRDHALGFCGAIRAGWQALEATRDVWPFDYVLHLEEDWLINEDVDVRDMAAILTRDADVAQVALLRGPVNAAERKAGGLIESWPLAYERIEMTYGSHDRAVTYERHSLFWTTNPSLYRAGLMRNHEWPEAPRCEERFGQTLERLGRSFAFFGSRHDSPRVTHMGDRTGHGY